MYDAPIYVWILVLIGAIGMPAMTVVALDRGAITAGLGRRAAAGVAAGFGAALGGWLALSGVLAGAGMYRDGLLVAFAAVLLALLLALLLAARIPVVSRILAQPSAIVWFTLPNAVRVVGVVFLLLMAQGHLPAGFALPAGLGDIAVGLAVPFVARELARATEGAARDAAIARATRFHLLGLLDLVVAVSMAVVLSPDGFLPSAPSTAALGFLPLALIPTVAVPLAIALHLVSLRQLRAAVRNEASAGGWRPTGQPGPVWS